MTVPFRMRRGCSPLSLMGCGCGLLAAIGIVLVFFILGMQYVYAHRDPIAWNRESYAQCQQNMAYLRQALLSYQKDHHQFPKRLDDLRGSYLDSDTRLRCPLEMQEHGIRYQYTPEGANPTDPLITCSNHGQGTLVLQHDGRIRLPSVLPRPYTPHVPKQ